MKLIYTTLLLVFSISIFAQNHHQRFKSVDVVHYKFHIELNDKSDQIDANAMVLIKFLKPVESFTLDLVSIDSTRKGMQVESVKVGKDYLKFVHKNNQLKIEVLGNESAGTVDVVEYQIAYSGIPQDGLIISENKFGDRTFFGDNWPDRAKHWLPTVDHPSDKATLNFIVDAPKHYKVISNGLLKETKLLNNNLKRSIWNENVPISTKLMVIGVANFSVGNNEVYNDIPVSSWVFPQNESDGFLDYQYGAKALKYFSELIGPYSYEKLAHVQSKTRYGGMENATCIFYSERTVNGKNEQERLFAHETAHQWFGNSVTEQNWHHLWLSEGFATYFTHVYNQHFHGEEKIKADLKKDRIRVIEFAEKKPAPIIDTTVNEYIRLLNANSYQKASWFLHMLRHKLGDKTFFKGIQNYYNEFQNSTVLTHDFRNTMEEVYGKELDAFFKQWLWQAGHPKISFDWKQNSNKKVLIKINQNQDYSVFSFPLEVQIKYKSGGSIIESFLITEKKHEFSFKAEGKVESIELDPNVKLLFEEL